MSTLLGHSGGNDVRYRRGQQSHTQMLASILSLLTAPVVPVSYPVSTLEEDYSVPESVRWRGP